MRVKIGCHTFRATGITAYLEAGGTLENAQAMAAHESLLRDNLDERRIASPRNVPERIGHCLIRMLPSARRIVNRVAPQTRFLVRSVTLLSRPDLALPESRRAAERMRGAEPPGATRSAIFRASMARLASTGPSAK